MSATASMKSTIVRANALTYTLARAYFTLASRLFPDAASRQVERIFTTPPRYAGRGVPLAEARRRSVRLGARDLALWEAGPPAAPAVLLVHGWGGRGVQMESFIAPLRQRGFRVVWFDQPGHGESGKGPVGLPDFVRAIEAIREVHGPFHAMIGHSLGAAALGIALRRGLQLERVVFVSSPASMGDYAKAFTRMLGIAPWVREKMRLRLERRYGMRFADIDRIDELERVTAPALFVHDAGDADVKFDDALRLSQKMRNARLLRTHGLGHRRILRAEGVVGIIAGFVGGADDVPGEWPRLPSPAPLY